MIFQIEFGPALRGVRQLWRAVIVASQGVALPIARITKPLLRPVLDRESAFALGPATGLEETCNALSRFRGPGCS
jgi:hypothetical protein